MKERLRLDAIVTVVDAGHVLQHLDSDECQAQIAFADVVLLNKCDLVDARGLAEVRTRIAGLNRLAVVHETINAALPVDQLLGIRAFDLAARSAESPDFLREELPFEWAGLYDLEPGRYRLDLDPGPDPTIDLVLGGPGLEQREVHAAWKRRAILRYSGDPRFVRAGRPITAGDILYRLPVDADSGASTALDVAKGGRYVLFTQHLPEEFGLTLSRAGETLAAVEEHRYASPHSHDDSVGSVGLRLAGDLDPARFEAWVVDLLRRRGTDIYRSKGIISLAGDPQRFVFQGVHMLFDGQPGRAWDSDTPRESQLVFIGRDLDRAELDAGLRACLA
jgi:G3E family GTPase